MVTKIEKQKINFFILRVAQGDQNSDINFLPEHIKLEKFQIFLEKYQKVN